MILALLALVSPQAPEAPDFRVQDLKAHIYFLASESLEGREAGTRGGHLAAQYVATQFRRYGLEPLPGQDSFLLPFEAERRTCYNTAAWLPGTDSSFQDQVLVIGGHHDHAGLGGGTTGGMGFPGEIHNGADDNASGTAAVLELAEYFAAHPTPRPILFMTFSAEEKGLLGSQAFLHSDVLPKHKMRAMLNLDMVGNSENGYLFVGGLGTALEFEPMLAPAFEKSDLKLELKEGGRAPSDNSSFYEEEIPALFFFTNVHPRYHLPADDPEHIQYEGEVEILKLVRDITVAIQNFDGPLTFMEQPRMAVPADFGKRMSNHMRRIAQMRRQKGKLGIDTGDPTRGGLAIRKVREDSAAEEVGLLSGDVLVMVANRKIQNRDDLIRALGPGRKGDLIDVVVLRDGERLQLQATLK
ncbi:MAG: PDZ domain-containing protein [Planctomycetota bacterium]|nr:MAG: PDZ domain-containing protein [Planctomycetota bacterium]